MKPTDPVRMLKWLSAVVVVIGVGAFAIGVMLHSLHHAVDVGVQADQELLDRLKRGEMSSGSGMSLERYANDSLGYHRAIQGLYGAIATGCVLCGAGLTITGGLQLRVLSRIRGRRESSDHSRYVSPAT